MASKPRVKVPSSVKAGEVFEVKTLISHKMETGLRKDKKTGEKIPRNIVNDFVAQYNGKEVFRMALNPSVSANPYISFYLKVDKAGELVMTWKDDSGKTWTAKKAIAVQ